MSISFRLPLTRVYWFWATSDPCVLVSDYLWPASIGFGLPLTRVYWFQATSDLWLLVSGTSDPCLLFSGYLWPASIGFRLPLTRVYCSLATSGPRLLVLGYLWPVSIVFRLPRGPRLLFLDYRWPVSIVFRLPLTRVYRFQATSVANTKHLYNICTTSAQLLRRWSNIVQMLYKCFVFAGSDPCLLVSGYLWPTSIDFSLPLTCIDLLVFSLQSVSFSIKLHSETQVSARLGMSGGRSPRHA